MGWDGMGWNGMGWDGMGWDGMGWDGMGWEGMGWDGMGWDGTGWDGMGWDGTGWDGTGRKMFHPIPSHGGTTFFLFVPSHGMIFCVPSHPTRSSDAEIKKSCRGRPEG
ncbi:unnamed protein product [Rotaria socialis]